MGKLQHPYVVQLGNRLRPCGLRVRPDKLHLVLEHMGWDVDLAQTAFLLQPSWLVEMVGPRELQER